ncbi:MAG: oligosaccharide flippase family protein [Desulfobacteraceae bacterium]|nr:oligosaccharide flippase family protein [Desulfobacteraceae bacterium]
MATAPDDGSDALETAIPARKVELESDENFRMRKYPKIYTDYLKVFLGSSTSKGLSFLNALLIARLLGVADFGKFTLFNTFIILTWQFATCFDITFVRYARVSNSNLEKEQQLRAAILLKIIYGALCVVLGYPLAYMVACVFIKKPEILTICYAGIISGVFIAFLMTLSSIYQERESFGKYSVLYLAYTLTVSLIILSLYYLLSSADLVSLIAMITAAAVLLGISSLYQVFRRIQCTLRIEISIISHAIGFGKWVFGITVLYFIFERMDLLFIAAYCDYEQVGIYSAAVQITMFYSLVCGSISGVFLPKSMKAVQSIEDLKIYFRAIYIPVCFLIVCLMLVFLFAPALIEFIYGPSYGRASFIVRLLTAGWVFQALYLPLQYLFYAIDRSRTRFYLETFKLGMIVSLLYWLVPAYGIAGGGMAFSIAHCINSLVSILTLYQCLVHRNQFAAAAVRATAGSA